VPLQSQAIVATPVELEIFFDLSCPFCLLAKVTLDEMLRSAPVPVGISWSPLILLPTLPASGIDFQTAHRSKYGERARELQLHVERRAESLGLRIDHSRITKVPNTIDAHRAVRFAASAGRTAETIDAILGAYFVDGRDITDRNTLADIVQAVGLDAAEFRDRIGTDWLRAEVLTASETSASRGAHSVPSYRLNGMHIESTADLIPELRKLCRI
jgi:predicted DsbA family dithiol-disulfide isomerase